MLQIFSTKSRSSFNRTCFVFSREKKSCKDEKMNSQKNRWIHLDSRDVPLLMKTKHPVHIMVLGLVITDGDEPFHMTAISTRTPTSSAARRQSCPGSRLWLLEEPRSGNRTLCHATQAGEPSINHKKISVTVLPIKPNRPTPGIANMQDHYVWGTVKRETNKTPSKNQR